MIRKSLSLATWVFIFQLIGYFAIEKNHYQLSSWYQTLSKSPLHPPEIIFPLVWSTLYMMITIAGWLLWQARRDPDAKSSFTYYLIQILMSWAWTPIFFRLHWVGLSFLWAVGLMFVTFMTIVSAAEKFELAASLMAPYLLWLLYLTYLCGYIWINN